MRVVRYQADYRAQWDDFVAASKNGTFLFNRSYMDYHSARFIDHSLLVFDAKGALIALVPANRDGERLQSHGGLTYGGVICGPGMTTPTMLSSFDAVLSYLRSQGIRRVIYKTIPHIYHRQPAEEDRYALFLHGARLYRRDVLSVIELNARLPFQKRRQRKIAQASRFALQMQESRDYASFWSMLTENLAQAHGVAPVHSLDEIKRLSELFPENIRLHLCSEQGQVAAGALIFDTGRVAHAQYISSSPRAREIGALDHLFSELITSVYARRPYFDFGISNEENGRYLNVGLIEQKEGFGARAVVHDFYELDL